MTEREKNLIGDKSIQDEIARRAYALYEARGRVDGYDVQDWVQAEGEVLHAVLEGSVEMDESSVRKAVAKR